MISMMSPKLHFRMEHISGFRMKYIVVEKVIPLPD